MTILRPVPFNWNGEAMEPLARFRNLCNKQYAVGEVYILEVLEQRSRETHAHYFACIGDAFKNLPEDVTTRYPTLHPHSPEHLRKWALCQVGFADEMSIACSSAKQAREVAGTIRVMDEYAVITVRGTTVRIFRAQSQSMHAMGKAVFQESKQKVLDKLAEVIGVEPAALMAQNPPDRPGSNTEPAGERSDPPPHDEATADPASAALAPAPADEEEIDFPAEAEPLVTSEPACMTHSDVTAGKIAGTISERALANIERQRGGVTEERPLPTTQTGKGALASSGEQADKAKTRVDGAAAGRSPLAAPQTAVEYGQYLQHWLEAMDDVTAIDERWTAEFSIRNACQINPAQLRKMDGMVGSRVYGLRLQRINKR